MWTITINRAIDRIVDMAGIIQIVRRKSLVCVAGERVNMFLRAADAAAGIVSVHRFVTAGGGVGMTIIRGKAAGIARVGVGVFFFITFKQAVR